MSPRHRARRLGLATAVASALVLSACWPQYRQNPDRTGHNAYESALTTATVGDLTEGWRVAAGSPSGFVDGDVLTTTGGDLHRLDAATGAVEWTWTSPPDVTGPTVQERPVVVAGAVLATWYDREGGGFLHPRGQALDPETGAPTDGWDGGVAALRPPLVLTESRCVSGSSCVLPRFAVYDTGTSDMVVSGLSTLGSSTLGDGVLYGAGTALDGGRTVAALPVEEGAPMCAPPGVRGRGEVVCPLWETPIDGDASPLVVDPGGDVVYAGTDVGVVSAFDAASGGVLWSTPVGGAVVHEPALAEGVLYVGTADGELQVLDAATGGPLWSAGVGAGEAAGPPSVGGAGPGAVVYAATTAGDVAGFAAAGCGAPACDPLWTGNAGGAVVAGPLVAHGTVLVGVDAATGPHEVIAYRLP
jgi:outer membrane protein assembly factor BamB